MASDTLKTWRHVPLYNYDGFDDFLKNIPRDCQLIGIEQTDKSRDLTNFVHPERAIYILGAEDDGLPHKVMDKCQAIVHISTPLCLNVAVAGSIVMFHRANQKLCQN